MKQLILIVDDDPGTRFGLSRYLAKEGFDIQEASNLSEAREAVVSRRFDAVILDQKLPDGNGVDWILDLRQSNPDIAIVVITGAGDIPVAVEAMRRGADNFLTKPVNMHNLNVFLKKSLELGTLRRKDSARQRLVKKAPLYFGENDAARTVLELATVAAENDAPILIQGETGTGKGMLAQWIHEHSTRHGGPFVEINCSGLGGELLASELFGHAKGAFTSAVQDRQGLIEVADGGTLFLDEIGDMELTVQAQFLKVIEEKQYRRLGESRIRTSDFRLICATNRDLSEAVSQGTFRQDLYFRIQVFPVRLPPLREQTADLPGLVRHLLSILQSLSLELSSEVMTLLAGYPWPGNIRELKNVLERALLLARGGSVTPKHFPGLVRVHEASGARELDRLEEQYLKSMIERSGDDLKKVAEAMGISRATLYRKLRKIRES